MSTLGDDLASINLQFLMLLREAVRANQEEAAWRFNLTQQQIKQIPDMKIDEIRELAESGRAVLSLFPPLQRAGIDQKLVHMLTLPVD